MNKLEELKAEADALEKLETEVEAAREACAAAHIAWDKANYNDAAAEENLNAAYAAYADAQNALKDELKKTDGQTMTGLEKLKAKVEVNRAAKAAWDAYQDELKG